MAEPRPPLFGWLDAFASGLRPRDAVALLIALDSRGTTGQGAVVNAARLAERLGLSERQVYRHVRGLVDEGWLVLTTSSAPGRQARYSLGTPDMFACADVRCTPDTSPTGDVIRSSATPDTSPPGDVTRHLTLSGRTPDTSPTVDVGVLRVPSSEEPPVGVDAVGTVSESNGQPTPTTTGRARLTGDTGPPGWAVDIDHGDNQTMAALPGTRLLPRANGRGKVWWILDLEVLRTQWPGGVDDSVLAERERRAAQRRRDAEAEAERARRESDHRAWLASPEGQAAEAERQAAIAQAKRDARRAIRGGGAA